MTRNADEAIDEQQLALSRKCEELLASDTWNSANIRSYDGLCARLEAFKKAGLPSMRVVSHKKLQEIGRIPRSNEQFQEDALTAVRRCGKPSFSGDALAVIIFFSHRWLRPNWCESMQQNVEWGSPARNQAVASGHAVGDPDDASRSKAKALIAWGNWFHGQTIWSNDVRNTFQSVPAANESKAPGGLFQNNIELFYWIDWACTNQDDPGPDMAALPAYVGACTLMLAGWNDVYAGRAWCQVELLMGYAFAAEGNKVLVLPENFHEQTHAHNWSGLAREDVTLPDPCSGNLSNPDDMKVIATLRDVAARSSSFSCWRVFCHDCACRNGALYWGLLNVMACCQCCGVLACRDTRAVRAGSSRLCLLRPSAQDNQM